MKRAKIISYMQIACAGLMALAVSFAQGGTVAYWPMVMDPETGGTSRKVADVSGNDYTLDVMLVDSQVTNTSDVAFSRPPNGPSEVTAASCVETVNGTSLTTHPFQRGTGNESQTSDPLILAMGLRHDFTIEGYMYVKSLKHTTSNRDTVIAFSGKKGSGDWLWYLDETAQNSNTRNVVVSIRAGDGVDNSGVLGTIDDSEILGGWHHYALVFKFNEGSGRSRWTFYLDGMLRGSKLMNNHGSGQNEQHDYFRLGGADSSAKKVFDAKLAFWRVSDEALPSGSLLCHQTFATTVAYWPMNVFGAFYNNAARMIVPDAADERNTLMLRDTAYGGVSYPANNIGWTTPPNPDADLTAAGVSCPSRQMVRSGNNTTMISGQYYPVFSTVTNAPVIEATTLCTNFTIEGFAKFTALPADSSKNQIFVSNTLAEKGGWCWNLYGADANGNLAMKVSYNHDGTIYRKELTLCGSLRAEELLNVWNHYALSFTPGNGNGKTEWRFYLNGRLLGVSSMDDVFGNYGFSAPSFCMSGAPSGSNPQALTADMTCWRVSNRVLARREFLCGVETPAIPAGAFVWKGAADSAEWSTGSVLNWTADGAPVAWTDAKDAYFDDTCDTNRVEITGTVTPASINVQADSDMRLDFSNARSSVIGDGCTNFVKSGVGTFEIYYGDNSAKKLANGAFPIEVREGCLKVSAANSNGALGDASRGYEVKVYDYAKLWLNGRNAIGSATPDVANDSVFTVYTNGTFDMSCASDSFNIQALGTLDLLGGNFVAPARCHGLGYLLIRNRLTLGCNPGKRPYVFPDVKNNENMPASGITIGRNTEFKVENVTGDAASDGIFNCAVLARNQNGWQDAQNPCGFRKTGNGTMELNNSFKGGSDNYHSGRPTGVIAVEAGELRVNVDYSLASKYTVADGAFLSGAGKVSRVEFAAGAGLRVDAGASSVLELAGADFAGGGVVEISGVSAAELKTMQVNCAKVVNPVTGGANLSGWIVKVNGVEVPRVTLSMHDGFLRASAIKGFYLIFR